MFFIHTISYFALIDIGSTHSYVSSTVFVKLSIFAECNTRKVSVISPLGQSVRVDKVYRKVPLEIHRVVFLVNLMEFPFGEFDLILRMNWLMEHQVNLDCAFKRVTLKTNENCEIIMIGEHQDYLSNVIFSLVAEKLIRKGCKAYLASVSDLVTTKLFVSEIHTMRDFPDVFPEELLSVTLDTEVEFITH